MVKSIVVITLLTTALSTAYSAELQHNFSSPSFSGIGYSSHVLTIHQLETQARDKNKAGLHNALEDCVSQAQAVQTVFERCGITEKR